MSTISPNMNLILPGVSTEPGPAWASELNNSLTLIDQHNHSAGSGVQINPAGININTSMPFNNNPAISLQASVYTAQTSLSTLQAVYVTSNGELTYNDGAGNIVAITHNGSVNAGAGSITGLVSPASASYSAPTFIFESNSLTAANIDVGSVILRNITASSKGLTLNPPAAMASNFSITLPNLPVSQKIMTLDNSGNMAAPYTVDGSTISIVSNVIGVPPGGIGSTQLANTAVTPGSYTSANITVDQQGRLTAASSAGIVVQQQLLLNNPTGHGSSATSVRNWGNVQIPAGSALTYSSNAVTGDTVTVNTTGVYSMQYSDATSNPSGGNIGITINSTTLTSDVSSIPYVDGGRGYVLGAQNLRVEFSITLYLTAGDIIRAQDSSTSNLGGNASFLNIIKVA